MDRLCVPYEQSFMATELDLGSVLYKLCHRTRGFGLREEQARYDSELYRRWLWLVAAYPKKHLVPSEGMDRVWHAHILDTIKYKSDCAAMFDAFLDHNPFAGMENQQAALAHARCFQATKNYFAKHFPGWNVTSGGEALCAGGYCDSNVTMESWRPRFDDLRAA